MKLLVLALLILYDSMLIFQLEHVKALDTMAPYAWESGDFRAMRLGRDAAGRPFLDYEELAMAMLTENFDLTGKKLSGEPLFSRSGVRRNLSGFPTRTAWCLQIFPAFPSRKVPEGTSGMWSMKTAGWRNGPLTDPGPMRGAISWLGFRRRGSIRWCP